jgi:outer membrane protein
MRTEFYMPPLFIENSRFYLSVTVSLILGLSAATSTQAEDLLGIFREAAEKDPQIRQARASFNAQHTQLDQGYATLKPRVNINARQSRDTSGVDGQAAQGGFFNPPQHSFSDGFTTKGYGLSLSQTLLNFQAWYSLQSLKDTDKAASLNLAQAEQQLIQRVAVAYFDVLRSQINLNSLVAQETAALQVLEQTKERFEVGLVPITDVYDSQANADLAGVNRLVEENNLSQRWEALEAITGRPYKTLADLSEDFPIVPNDSELDTWVAQGLDQNPQVQAARLVFEASKSEAKAAKAAMLPTLELNMNYNWNQSGNPLSFVPNLASESSAVTVNFSYPLYQGGANSARLRQAYYTRDANEEVLTKAERDNTQAIRNYWRSVETDVRAVQARAQALLSAQSALEATEVGAEVGTRNVVDVVLAQRTLFQAERDLANARVQYVLDVLNLKFSAGVLSPQDVVELNAWLSE